ncbi:hypothetical protein C6496_18210 [Candidatus Poribacteria bacterium]|nr:MAG: hypothetical protein C6496_18210 [Candidatus Poribacteria bacterium]
MKKPFVISVSSISGGGKTALSIALHKSLPNSSLFHFDDFEDSNIYPSDFYDWSQRGGDVEEFNCPGMQTAVNAAIRQGKFRWIILDFPFGRWHSCFRDVIDFAVFIDTPLDVAMARRILRDCTTNSDDSPEETLNRLWTDLSNYLDRARYPYLDTCKYKVDSDLVLDGWRSLDDLKNDVITVLNQETW